MKQTDKAISQQPFKTDTEYLDSEFGYLRTLTNLMHIERRFDDTAFNDTNPNERQVGQVEQVSTKELTRRLVELRSEEQEFRQMLDGRLEVHRREATFKLGLDILCTSAGLSAEERFVLNALALPAVNTAMANDSYANLGLFGSELQVNEIIQLLRPNGSEDWLTYRKLFHIDAPLVKEQLITVEYPSKTASPGDHRNCPA